MVKQNVRVTVLSLHFRPAEKLTKLAMKYEADIQIQKGDSRVCAKSFLNMLGAGIKYGDEVIVECDGTDENEALSAVSAFLRDETEEL